MPKKTKTDRILGNIRGKNIKTPTQIGIGILPNHSGDHSAGIIRKTPINNQDIANKKYVDDEIIANSHDPVTIHSTEGNGLSISGQELSLAEVGTTSSGAMTSALKIKLDGIETGAEINNISDADVTDLTDAGDSDLHYHSADRDRANHTGTQTASTISDFDTEVTNNSTVASNSIKSHDQDTDQYLDKGGANEISTANVKAAYTHSSGDGSDHADVASNTTHSSSNGSDHGYINQDVTTTGTPTFTQLYINDGNGEGRIVYNSGDYISMREGIAYWKMGGSWEYQISDDEFAPYSSGDKSLGSSAKKWGAGYFAGIIYADTDVRSSGYLYGNHKSSDGSAGITTTRGWTDSNLNTHTVTIKDGLITSWSVK